MNTHSSLKNFLILCLFTIFTIFQSGCLDFACKKGDGKVIKQERKLTAFNAVDISGAFNVVLCQGSPASLYVEADENLQSIIITKVVNKKLIIENEESICESKALKICITAPGIESISISGSVDLKSKDTLKAKKFKIEVSGIGNIGLTVSVEKLTIDCSGSATILLNGKAGDVDAEISGASTINAFGMMAENFQLASSGVGKANLNVTNKLDVDISGTASVRYKGNPKVKQEISGVGSLEKVE
jgi:hypothetical protein